MRYQPDNPLIVQSDHSMLLETMGPHFRQVRDDLLRFAELVKSPEYVHTWRVTPLSLWNAAASGVTADEVVGTLERWSKYDVPPNIPVSVRETMARYGRLVLHAHGDALRLEALHPMLMLELRGTQAIKKLLGRAIDEHNSVVDTGLRGELKQALTAMGHPVRDLAGYVDGEALEVVLRAQTRGGDAFGFRGYQQQAIEAFFGGRDDGGSGEGSEGGSGVVVLPCGAGKTIVGIGAMAKLGMRTLILCTNITALRQWRDEILDKTELSEDDLGEYSGEDKNIRPVTLSTYQILTYRKSRKDVFKHFGLFDQANWGLIIYDEVHLLPAPVFRSVAALQARRRLGLTATLIREDGKQTDVFALIGPKRFDMPWKDLERQGWIATATCTEIRVNLNQEDRLRYAVADERARFRIAATNPGKEDTINELLNKHAGERILVLGMYLDQLHAVSERWSLPMITGKTSQTRREELFEAFRSGEVTALAVSKVGNFSVDLPDASVAIQISGTWGSRQEEAQRLGRILRPKKGKNSASFYTLVSRDSTEQEYAEKRQLFLTEQGYAYRIETREP